MVTILASMMKMTRKKIANHRTNEVAVATVDNEEESFGAVVLGSSHPFKKSFDAVTKSSCK
jgi:hypothetical protein